MKCRLASKEDLLTLKELWYECFLEYDSQASIDYYFSKELNLATTFVLEVNNEIVTSLQLNQHQIWYNNHLEEVSFVIGVATFTKHRKKGYMKVLLEFAINYAKEVYQQKFMILQAYDWNIYRPFGFFAAYYKREIGLSLARLSKYQLANEAVLSEKLLLEIYQKYTQNLNGYKIRNKEYFRAKNKMSAIDGIEVFCSNDAYIYYEIKDHNLIISECAFSQFSKLLELVSALVTKIKVNKVKLTCDLLNTRDMTGTKQLFMMVKELSNDKFEIAEQLYISEWI